MGLTRAFLLFFMISGACYALDIEFTIDEAQSRDALPAALLKGLEHAYDLNVKGLDALDNDKFDDALGFFTQALGELPEYTDAENNIGVVHYRKGEVGAAQKIWQSIVVRQPSYSIAHYNCAVVLFHEKLYSEALKKCDEALKLNNRFLEAQILTGRINLALGQVSVAIGSLKKGFELSPTTDLAYNYYAYGLIANHDTASAEKILAKHTDNTQALLMLGTINARRGNLSAALLQITSAIEHGADPAVIVDFCSQLVDGAHFAEARNILKTYFAKTQRPVADAYLLAGIAAKESGDIGGSQVFFEKGLAAWPGDPFLRYNLGQIYFHQGKAGLAEAVWQSMADSMNDPGLYYLRALNARSQKDLPLAQRLVSQAIKLDSKAEYLDFLGIVFFESGKKKEAEEQFRKAVRADPSLHAAQMHLAALTKTPQEVAQAIDGMKQELSLCKSDCGHLSLQLSVLYSHQKSYDKSIATLVSVPDAEKTENICRHLASYYAETQNYPQAIDILEKAKKRIAVAVETESQLAEYYLLAGHYAKAIDGFTNVLSQNAGNPWRTYYQIGYAYMEQNEFDKAVFNFEQSLVKKSDNVAARGLLAFVLNRTGQSDKARVLWEKNIKDDPTNPVTMVNMGLLLEKQDKWYDALGYYKKALVLRPDQAELNINIGNVYAEMKQYDDAFMAYSKAYGSSKKDIAAYNAFELAQKIGNSEKAKKTCDFLQEQAPGSISARRAMAELALMQGDTAKALNMFNALPQKDDHDKIVMAAIYAQKGDMPMVTKLLAGVADSLMAKEKTNIRAACSFTCGNFTQAYSLWKSLADTSYNINYNLALTAFRLNKFDEAYTLGKELITRSGTSDKGDLYRMVGNAAFGSKQWDKAKQYYLQLSTMRMQDPVVQYNCAVACYNLGQVPEAWAFYQKARELDPKLTNTDIEKRYASTAKTSTGDTLSYVDSLYNVAVTLQDSGKDSLALPLYRKILSKDSTCGRAWNNLGAMYLLEGSLDSAEIYFIKAVGLTKELPEVYANMVSLYIAKDSLFQARRWFVKGQVRNPDDPLLKQAKARLDSVAAVKQKKKK